MKRLWLAVPVAVCAVAVLTAAGFGGSSEQAKAPIPLGILTSLTGTFAPWGLQVRDGAKLAVAEVNKAGGVKGRKLKLYIADDQSSPNAGIDGFKRLTQQNHVVGIDGLISSDVATATARLTEQAHIPMFLVKAGATEILSSGSRYTFRTCLPAAAEVAQPILQFAQQHKVQRVGAIIADYAWGQAIKSSLQTTFASDPNIKLNVQVAPVTTKDFTTYIRALQQFGAQMIVATGHPPGSGPILVESGQLGMKVPVTGAYNPFSLVAGGAGAAAYGRWGDYKCQAVGSKSFWALDKRFLKMFPKDTFMEDDAVAAYAYVKIMAQAIGAVGTNPVKIAKYVHAHTFKEPGYTSPLKWTAWGEWSDARIAFDILTKGPPPQKGLVSGASWWPRQLSLSKPLKPFKP